MSAATVRAQRKQDLLLASRALRAQALGDAGAIAERADALALRLLQLRALLAHPAMPLAASLFAAGLARLALRRRHGRPWLRRAWLAWRVWRAVTPWLRTSSPQR